MEPYAWELDWDTFTKTGKLEYIQKFYIGDYVEANKKAQKEGGNGFTEERSLRKIGSIPPSVYNTHIAPLPVEERPAAIYRLLNKEPMLRTVEKIKTDTPSDGYIIIK